MVVWTCLSGAPPCLGTDREAKDSAGNYLVVPVALDGVPRVTATSIPTTLTVGTSTDTSDVFVGDWANLALGVRTSMEITVLRERSADIGMVEILAW